MTTTPTIPAVTDATFAAETGTGLVAVEFGAEWCAPCRMMAPAVEAVARDYAPRLRMLQLVADTNPATMARFGVRGLPTMLVFRDGEVVDRIVGAHPLPKLRERIERLLGAR